MKTITTLFVLLTIFSLNTFAQDIPYTVLEGHTESVNSVVFSPDGKTLASGSSDKNIGLWEADTGKHIRTIEGKAIDRLGAIINTFGGHTERVYSVSFSPDGQMLASGSDDRTIRLWDVRTGNTLHTLVGENFNFNVQTLEGHPERLIGLSFSPDGKILASGSANNNFIRLWDVSTGNLLRTLEGHQQSVGSLSFSPDGRTLASGSGGRNATIRLWDVSTGILLQTLGWYKYGVYSLSFSPDGKTLASGSGDAIISLWDVSTGNLLRTLEGHRQSVGSLSFSPDGKTLASGSRDQIIHLWDIDTGTLLRTLDRHPSNVVSRFPTFSFSPDGEIFASGSLDDTIHLWDVSTGTLLRTLEGHTSSILSVSFSPDGQVLASGSGDIRLWDVDTGTYLGKLEGHKHIVSSVSFSPDGKTLASWSGGSDNTLRLWDTTNITKLLLSQGHTDAVRSVTFSPDGTTLASGSWDDTIRLWDVATGTPIRILTGHTDRVRSVTFSPDGTILASGSRDKTVRLWDVATGTPIRILTGHTDRVRSVTFSPDGTILASGSRDKTVRLWDVATGTPIRTLSGHRGYINSVAFSPDGQMLASGNDYFYINSTTGYRDSDYTIRLWDVETGNHLRTLSGHTDGVSSVMFSPDGQVLVSGGGWDIRFWKVSTGVHLHTLSVPSSVTSVVFNPNGLMLASGSGDDTRLWATDIPGYLLTINGHTSAITSVAFSLGGKTLASGSNDNTIRLWDVETGNHIRTLTGHTDDVNSIAFSPDGQTLVSGSKREIRVWDATTSEVLNILGPLEEDLSDIAFSPDGQTLASAHYASYGRSKISLWDVTTGKVKKYLHSPGSYRTSSFTSVAFSPDGQTVAGGGRGDSEPFITFWNVTIGERTRTLTGHTATVSSIAFSPDGSMLASGSYGSLYIGGLFASRRYDGSTGLWNTRTGKRLYTLEGHTATVSSVAFSPNGSKLVSGNEDSTIRLWELPDTRMSLTPIPVVSPAIGEQFTVNVSIIEGENVGGYQVSLAFDPTALRYVESVNGDYLQPGAFFVPPVVSKNKVTLGASSLTGVGNGDGTLATVTFEVLEVKESIIELFDVILTDSEGEHLPQLPHNPTKVVEPSVLASSAVISLIPTSILSPAAGEQFTFNVDIAGGRNVEDFEFTFDFDTSALKSISIRRGDYLTNGVGNGDGTLETITFEVLDVKASTVSVSGYLVAPNGLRSTPTFESAEVIVPLLGDVNRDGSVNILDLVQVASSFGQSVPEGGNPADVNEDGVVNIVDLVKVAGALSGEAAAPSTLYSDLEAMPTRATVQKWLSQAQQLNLTDATSQRGILFLEQLLASLTPKETALLPNYPNPFNPETWIPYQLAKPADVTITIYAVDGTVVRTLALGYQPIGIYQDKNRAAYWDGKNEVGEPVASSVYFYTLKAGEFTATRKMLIRK